MMKFMSIAASTVPAGAATVPAPADDQPLAKGPPKTKRGEGKLPATGVSIGAVPQMIPSSRSRG